MIINDYFKTKAINLNQLPSALPSGTPPPQHFYTGQTRKLNISILIFFSPSCWIFFRQNKCLYIFVLLKLYICQFVFATVKIISLLIAKKSNNQMIRMNMQDD